MHTTLLAEIELHDAILQSLEIDFEAGHAKVRVAYYRSNEHSERQFASIQFRGIRNMSAICDLVGLMDNSRSGNINFWKPDCGDGLTYIYLLDGCIRVDAAETLFEPL